MARADGSPYADRGSAAARSRGIGAKSASLRRSRAAEALGLQRTFLNRLLRGYGLTKGAAGDAGPAAHVDPDEPVDDVPPA